MMNYAEAELRASAAFLSSTVSSNMNADSLNYNEAPATITAQSGDELIDEFIMEIDKEEREAEYRERQKRKGSSRNPEVCAQKTEIATWHITAGSLLLPLSFGVRTAKAEAAAAGLLLPLQNNCCRCRN